MNIREVAKEAGVSYMTVSRVLNRHPSVKPDTRTRVEAAMARHHYVPLHAATTISRKVSKVVGFVLPKLEYAFYEPFINEFHEACFARDLEPEIHFTQLGTTREESAVRALESRRALGVIVSGSKIDNRELRQSLTHIKKMVFLGVPGNGENLPAQYHYAGFDDGDVMGLVLDHLLERGHRRFLYVSSRMGVWKKEGVETRRGLAFEKQLKKSGGSQVGTMELDNDNYEEVAPVETLSHWVRHQGVTAAVCDNDFAALKIYRGAALAGLSIPGDLSVVGVDDLFMSRYLTPPLTTVGLPYASVIPTLLDYFESGGPPALRLKLTPQFQSRESVSNLNKTK